MRSQTFLAGLFLLTCAGVAAADGNRLAYLDGTDNYYPSRTFPKLTTPAWVGEDGVEAVVILSIDDMRGHEKWEAFLRPVIRRLKQIDGRAPVSIMTNRIEPGEPHLQEWLKEGLSLETHTYDHPCPLLQGGVIEPARKTYGRCVDQMMAIPNSRAVAFRMPCCDSLNTSSPRFFREIFNATTEKGNFLTLDSSIFNVITADDPALPRSLVLDPDGQDRCLKYLPTDRTFVNYVENYPYPYVVAGLCWEFPCVTPSDWLADHRHKAANPQTTADWKAALDATVIKQGTFTLVIHPHGWCKPEQIVELIDHAVAKHGKKVKFLNFREAQERLNKNVLGAQTLRHPKNGQDNGVRLLDLDNDGHLDVVIGNEKVKQTRTWSPKEKAWKTAAFPVALVDVAADGSRLDAGARFGSDLGKAWFLIKNESVEGCWIFMDGKWQTYRKAPLVATSVKGLDRGVRLRNLDRGATCDVMIVANDKENAAYRWMGPAGVWAEWLTLPPGARVVNAAGKDDGLRFIDVDEDGYLDLIFSNEKEYGLCLFDPVKKEWGRKVLAGKAGAPEALPMISRKGTDNGAWFHSRHLWVQNENTALLKDHVDRRSFNDMLSTVAPTAKSPQAALKALHARTGFVAEQMVAEPLVQDPIAFAWGPDGKLWVVEMGDYPLGIDGKGKPGGKVLCLQSTKGDGKYDKSTVFLDGLGFPTGVVPWRKGVLITCAPDILYAEGVDGDGKADRKEVLFTGFVEGNQQHRVNSLVWGLDNWIYCANGDSGGKVRSIKKGTVVDISGRDFRIRPDTGEIDLQAGPTQYGRSRDDWGNWFGNNNSRPLWHFVLEDHYVRRNPHLAAPDPRVEVPAIPGAAPVYPVSRTVARFNSPDAANHFTSANSSIVYRDDLFGPRYSNSAFVSEPVHNLVHREVLAAQGVTFTSRRAPDEQTAEFLASADNWFRPTSLATGPDGALWVADMYREVIEHPQWIPLDWQKRLDLRAGHDQGRIYRVYPVGSQPRALPRLDRMTTAELVASLDSPSGWQRDLVQQMLLWRADREAVPLLENQIRASTRPLCRLHALCTLDGLDALTPVVLKLALADEHPGVRRHAVRLCDVRLSKHPELSAEFLKRVNDGDVLVRMQAAYSLGEWDDPRAGTALGTLALKDGDNRYLIAAAMSSVNRKNLDAVLKAVMTSGKEPPPAALVDSLLRMASALNHVKALATLLEAVAMPRDGAYVAWHFTALAGLLDALEQRRTPLAKLRDQGDPELKAAVDKLSGLFAAARKTVALKNGDADAKRLAIPLLGRGVDQQQEDVELLGTLLNPQTPDSVQASAAASLGRLSGPTIPTVMLRNWKSHGPTLRNLILDVLLRRDEWLKASLDALERKDLLAADVDAPRRQRLLEHRDVSVRSRAAKLFAGLINADRQKVIEAYGEALSMKGEPAKGVAIFTKNCSACHKLGDLGNVVGPDLASIGDKSPQGLLIAILDPNRAVETRYLNYSATTRSGLTLNGILASETGNSITLIGTDGKPQTVLRKDLEDLVSTGRSLMPEGLEKEIKPRDMTDLIAFVRSVVPQPKAKAFKGNKPEIVRPAAGGALLLAATNAEIYGRSLVFEEKHANLGYWCSDDDHAIWTVEVPQTGSYAVWLDWASPEASAGKAYALVAGANQLTGKVTNTGGWDTYKQAQVGTIVLSAGQQRLTFRPARGLSATAMMDFKSVKLVPVK